jgi:hypothetical protein
VSRWYTCDEFKRSHVSDYHSTGCDHGPSSDPNGRDANRTGSNGGSALNVHTDWFPVRRPLQGQIFVDGARGAVIRQNCTRANEHTVFQHCRLKDLCGILYLASRSNSDSSSDIGATPYDRLSSDFGRFSNVC